MVFTINYLSIANDSGSTPEGMALIADTHGNTWFYMMFAADVLVGVFCLQVGALPLVRHDASFNTHLDSYYTPSKFLSLSRASKPLQQSPSRSTPTIARLQTC